MKIELTKEQIELLTKNEVEKLNQQFLVDKQKLENKLIADIKLLESKLQADIAKLSDKFKYFEYKEKPVRQKAKIDTGLFLKMVEDKKPIKEIARFFKTSEQSIRTKLWKLNIKLTDN